MESGWRRRITFWPLTRKYGRTLRGHAGAVEGLAFTPDGKGLVSAGKEKTLRFWPLTSEYGERARLLDGGDRSLAYFPFVAVDPTGHSVVVGAKGGLFVAPVSGGPAGKFEGFGSEFVLPVAFGPENQVAAGVFMGPREDKVIRVWDLETGAVKVLGPVESAGEGNEGGFWTLQFAPDGRLLSIGTDGIRRWNVNDGSVEALVKTSWETAPFGTFSADGTLALVGRGPLTLYDLQGGGVRTLTSHGDVGKVALGPTGTIVASMGKDRVVRVGPITGEEPHLLFGHEDARSVAISPDGRWIAAGGDDGVIHIWPMPEGRPFHTLPYEELLTKLRSLTNVRVVEHPDSETGYRLEVGPFRGWKDVPVW